MKKYIFLIFIFSATVVNGQHVLPPLPYAEDALEPAMSRETIEYHHGKHVKTYVDNLNRLIPGTPFAHATLEQIVRTANGSIFNNGAQIWNHILFFDSFAPENAAVKIPRGELAAAIDRDFGSFDQMKADMKEAALGRFGSGWAWLVSDAEGDLSIVSTPNADNPLRDGLVPLLAIDVWEHAYYIDYRNERGSYLDGLWRIIDWQVMEERYTGRTAVFH